jgi:hypothetical protein
MFCCLKKCKLRDKSNNIKMMCCRCLDEYYFFYSVHFFTSMGVATDGLKIDSQNNSW